MNENSNANVKTLLRQLANDDLSENEFQNLSARLTYDAAARQVYHEWMDLEIGLAEWSDRVAPVSLPSYAVESHLRWRRFLGEALAAVLLLSAWIWSISRDQVDLQIAHHVVSPPPANTLLVSESFDYQSGRLGFAEGGRGWQGSWSLFKNGMAPAMPIVQAGDICSSEQTERLRPVGGHLLLGRASSGFRMLQERIDLANPGEYFLAFILKRIADSAESKTGMLAVRLAQHDNMSDSFSCGIDPEGFVFARQGGETARSTVSLTSDQPYLLVCKIASQRKKLDQMKVRIFSVDEPIPYEEPDEWTVVGPEVDSDELLDSVHLVAGLRSEFLLDELRLATSWQACFVR